MKQELEIKIIPMEEEKNPMDQELIKIMQDAKGRRLKQFIMAEINNSRFNEYPTASEILEDLK